MEKQEFERILRDSRVTWTTRALIPFVGGNKISWQGGFLNFEDKKEW